MKTGDKHLLSLINATSNVPFVYYSGATWDKAGRITNSKEWFTYLYDFNQQLKYPVVVRWLMEFNDIGK
jgi:hypothetical protein